MEWHLVRAMHLAGRCINCGYCAEACPVGIPLNRLLEPEDFVGPAVFLCSDAAAAVTGVLLPVDGGNLALNAGGSHIWPVD